MIPTGIQKWLAENGAKVLGYFGIALAVLAILVLWTYISYKWGSSSCEADSAKNALETNTNTNNTYEKIKKSVPRDSDAVGTAEFMLNHAVRQ